jgi:hypothetical protein
MQSLQMPDAFISIGFLHLLQGTFSQSLIFCLSLLMKQTQTNVFQSDRHVFAYDLFLGPDQTGVELTSMLVDSNTSPLFLDDVRREV